VPEVSVIVPVYDVEKYLPQCVESILGQTFSDLELVAVNDCSPDSSLQLLRRYAARDARVRIIDLQENVGLGRARNAGLDAATGRFVWFVDSDDWLVPDALEKAYARAVSAEADVVMVGWTRDYEDGRVSRGTGAAILQAAPAIFSADDYPAIFDILQIACNKLIRRDLLERSQLRFPAGWYEDTPFTFPLLLAARRMSTLSAELLRYRQRSRAITRTRSARHLELLSQWDRAMDKVERMAANPAEIRTHLFPLMMRHCARVLLHYNRLPASAQGEFVTGMASLYRRHRPDRPYPTSSWMERAQHALIPLGSVRLLKLHWRIMRSLHRKRRYSRRALWAAAGLGN
jgi:CDP-glycerol glycerophosphotransferase